jgi:hypothetical protein
VPAELQEDVGGSFDDGDPFTTNLCAALGCWAAAPLRCRWGGKGGRGGGGLAAGLGLSWGWGWAGLLDWRCCGLGGGAECWRTVRREIGPGPLAGAA